jgi:hypothetical protein
MNKEAENPGRPSAKSVCAKCEKEDEKLYSCDICGKNYCMGCIPFDPVASKALGKCVGSCPVCGIAIVELAYV